MFYNQYIHPAFLIFGAIMGIVWIAMIVSAIKDKSKKIEKQRKKEEERIKAEREKELLKQEEIQKAEVLKKQRSEKYKDLANANNLKNILNAIHAIDFKIAYMTNEEAYNYYTQNKEDFLEFREFCLNNILLINSSKDQNFDIEEDILSKYNESLKMLDISNYGDDTKELFETKIDGFLGVVKGVKAELEIRELLTKYFPSMHVIDSVNVSFEENKIYHDFENDAILVGKKGIFTIEVKSKTYTMHEHGREVKKLTIYSDGSTSEKEGKDLIKQSVEHANLLEVFLTKKMPGIDYLDVIHEIMVITNEEVEIVNQAPHEYNVVKPAGLRAAINKYPASLTEDEVGRIVEILSNNNVTPKRYPFLTVELSKIRPLIKQQEQLMNIYCEYEYI